MTSVQLKTMFGDFPITEAFKRGDFASPELTLAMTDVAEAHTLFKAVVRDLAFDVAELSVMTFLIAKANGVPLTLLPAVLMARFQHPYIVYNTRSGILKPKDLEGRRVGIRSITVTTVTWVRGMLVNDFGVELDKVDWVTFEDAHVAGVEDPPGVERAGPAKTLDGMLVAGELDAAILGAPIDHPDVRPLFPDPVAAAAEWRAKHDAIQLNHMVVAKNDVLATHPDAVRDIYRQLAASKRAAGLPKPGELDLNPFGLAANRRNLELAIDCVHAQGLIDQRYEVDELFADVTRDL
jgi:4,5-dihydroxyphthalate decarboxylase